MEVWRLDARMGGDGALVWWRSVESTTPNRVIVSAAAGSRTVELEQWWVASNGWEKRILSICLRHIVKISIHSASQWSSVVLGS